MSVAAGDYSAYAEFYDERAGGVPGDVEFYRALALEADGPVVELAVGTGRVALPIAEAGARVLGLDLSLEMLRIAATKARAAGVDGRLALARGDMRRFALRRPAALVTIPFRSFLHNVTTADQLATLAAVRDALRPGGRLALNVFNPNVLMIADGVRRGGAEQAGAGPFGADQRLEYEPTAQVSRTSWTFRRPGGRRVRFSFALRYVYRFEMEHLLERAGFDVEALYGDHFRAPFVETSTEMVWIARRR
jgi:SAM-dependent methyltransferase